jgi:hypothetical protein
MPWLTAEALRMVVKAVWPLPVACGETKETVIRHVQRP